MANEIEYLFLDDIQTGLLEDSSPLPGRADLLIAQMVKQMVFQRGGRVFAEPIRIL